MSQPPLLVNVTNRVKQGQQIPIANETWSAATTSNYYFSTDADGLLVTLFVLSVAGDITLNVYTQIDVGKDILLASFPTVSAPTANLLLKKVVNVMSNIRIEVISTDAASFLVNARGVAAAASSVSVTGATQAKASSTIVTTTPSIVVNSTLTDRSGMVVKNNASLGGARMWVGFSSAEASDVGGGYPLQAQESLGLDISGGVELWASSDSGSIDVRLLESGN